jgi:hypothetical protein
LPHNDHDGFLINYLQFVTHHYRISC